jgi:DNA-binding HxlR family transcriptional regulator
MTKKMKKTLETDDVNDCVVANVLAVQDTINVINGKWKAAIIYSLAHNKKRYSELLKQIPKMNPRMLSKELKDLEANGVITRTVYDTVPVTIEYELTKSGQAFKDEVLEVMLKWGLKHRKISIGK